MKNKKQQWRLIYLFPYAVCIYIFKQFKAKNLRVILGVCAACVLIISFIFVSVLSNTPETTNEITTMSASPSPAPSPSPDPTPAPVSLTLTFAGDCTLGTDDYLTYDSSFNAMYQQEGPEYFLKNVRHIFSSDDFTVVNFEGTLTESEERANKSYAFKGDRDFVEVLSSASVECANLANNHTQDYGEIGFSDTQNTLTKAGIHHFGFEETKIVDVNGVKVGFTGQFTVYEDPAHLEQLKKNIKALQDDGAQLIIANFHWGLEMDYYPDADQVELAHAAIDAGAHLVIGHHPHVLQGIEIYKGRYIAYSLGNFCFGGNPNPPDYDCMIFQQTFTIYGDTVEKTDDVNVIPCSCSSVSSKNDYCPTPAEDSEKTRILEKLKRISQELDGKNFFES